MMAPVASAPKSDPSAAKTTVRLTPIQYNVLPAPGMPNDKATRADG